VLNTSTPSLARAWDNLLGGGASFAADRALALRLEALYPQMREVLAASRRYAAEVITRIAQSGVDQYLDLGAGLPTRPSTHEVAKAILPAARVAYVDRDPTVTAHGQALVPAGVRYVEGDLAEPEAILASGDLGFIDLSRPVCLVLTLVLHVLDPGTARAVVGVLVRALAPGSYVVITACAGESVALPESVWPGPFTADDLASFLTGVDPVPPGVTGGAVVCGTGFKSAPAARTGPPARTGTSAGSGSPWAR
jgi:O-methyltransferase involved in polyketide biosynthesis